MAASFPDSSLPVVDRLALDSLIEMFGDDDMEAVIDLLDTFLSESQKQVNAIRTSFDTGDMATLHRMAHSLKSSSATFGAARLSAVCARLEQAAKDGCSGGGCAELLPVVLDEQQQAAQVLADARATLSGA